MGVLAGVGSQGQGGEKKVAQENGSVREGCLNFVSSVMEFQVVCMGSLLGSLLFMPDYSWMLFSFSIGVLRVPLPWVKLQASIPALLSKRRMWNWEKPIVVTAWLMLKANFKLEASLVVVQ